MINWFFLLLAPTLLAMPTKVEPGDTFNKVLLRQGVSKHSINLINAYSSELKPISQIAPGDEVNPSIDPTTKHLLSCELHGKKDYILNKEEKGFSIHALDHNEHLSIIRTNLEEDSSDPQKQVAQRIIRRFIHHPVKQIIAGFDNGRVISIKALSDTQSHYFFIQYPPNQLPHCYNQQGEFLGYLFARTPTQYTRISSPFNPKRLHPISKKIMPHKGVDLAAPINTPVWASTEGVIDHISTDTGYGNLIIMKHPQGLTTYYAHLNKFHKQLKIGQKISAFETIGYVGSTGHSTGPHLHFETRVNNKPYDPLKINLPTPTIEKLVLHYYF